VRERDAEDDGGEAEGGFRKQGLGSEMERERFKWKQREADRKEINTERN
jgi:hypothetical protein